MGTLLGHVAHGAGFIFIGLWHLFSHTKLHAKNPNSYLDPIWFRTKILSKYLELYLILFVATMSMATELFVRRGAFAPLDPDGTIPAYHLHNFEHISISLMFFIYSCFNIIFDRMTEGRKRPRPSRRELSTISQLLAAASFTQQLLMLHFHSIDHVGVEAQFHWLQQLPVAVAWVTMLMGIGRPRSFIVSFVRSASVMFEGVWLVVMGYAIWIPRFVAKGCFLKLEIGNYVVQCGSGESLERAKGLVNLLFSFCLTAMVVFCVVFYLVVVRFYGDGDEGLSHEYLPVVKESDDHDNEDLEALTNNH